MIAGRYLTTGNLASIIRQDKGCFMSGTMDTSIRYTFGAESDRGSIRERNEDYYGIYVPESDEIIESLGVLAIVSDGMGGHLSGAEASKKSVEVMGRVYYDGTGAAVAERGHGEELHEPRSSLSAPAVNRLRWAFLEANREVFEIVGEGRNGTAGTTCTAIVMLPDMMHIAHAGDSRAYLLSKGVFRQLTDDHSVVGEMVRKGTLSKEEAVRHPHRNVITKAVGLRANLDVDIMESVPVAPGDRMLLCSDGLYSMLGEEEIAKIIAGGTPDKICKRLVKRAKEEGGSDNITVIVAEKLS